MQLSPIIVDPNLKTDPTAKLSTLSVQTKNKQIAETKSKEFEAVFLAEMLEPVMEQSQLPPPFGGGFAEQTLKSLLTNEYAKQMVKAGGIGIAAQVQKQLLQNQEQVSWNK